MSELIRWRQIAEPADPQKISDLVAATGVFSAEEIRMAGNLATTTLDGTETYRFMFAEEPGGPLLGFTCFDRIPLTEVSFDLYWIAVAPERRRQGIERLTSHVFDVSWPAPPTQVSRFLPPLRTSRPASP